jgi:type I restriction enzyme R subunit
MLRAALYKAAVSLVRSYANISDELEDAGYSSNDINRIKQQIEHYLKIREIVRMANGEILDLKPYEADMRHLIDTYIDADDPRKISPFDNMGLLDLIVKTGISDAIASKLGALNGNKGAIAETIENNVRSKIIKEHLSDPAFFEKMSALLDEIIAARRAKAIEFEEYMKSIAELANKVEAGHADDTPEPLKHSPALRAIYHNLKQSDVPDEGDFMLAQAQQIDETIKQVRPDGWRGIQARENIIKAALLPLLENDVSEVERIFLIIKAQKEY